jgi:hypothetical protein
MMFFERVRRFNLQSSEQFDAMVRRAPPIVRGERPKDCVTIRHFATRLPPNSPQYRAWYKGMLIVCPCRNV